MRRKLSYRNCVTIQAFLACYGYLILLFIKYSSTYEQLTKLMNGKNLTVVDADNLNSTIEVTEFRKHFSPFEYIYKPAICADANTEHVNGIIYIATGRFYVQFVVKTLNYGTILGLSDDDALFRHFVRESLVETAARHGFVGMMHELLLIFVYFQSCLCCRCVITTDSTTFAKRDSTTTTTYNFYGSKNL